MKPSSMTQSNKKLTLVKAAFMAVFWVFVWQLLYLVVNKKALLPSPAQVATRLSQLCQTPVFWQTVFDSCLRVCTGFIIGIVAGCLMGFLCAKISLFYQLFKPILRIITTTPVASFIILAAVWITTQKISTFMTFLMVMPLIWNNIYQGFLNLDNQLLEVIRIYRLSNRKKWRALYIPSLLPYLSAGLSTGIGTAWKAGIAAEIIVLPALSIGREIYNSKLYIETTDLFAWTVVVIILSLLLEKLSFLLLLLVKKSMGGARS